MESVTIVAANGIKITREKKENFKRNAILKMVEAPDVEALQTVWFNTKNGWDIANGEHRKGMYEMQLSFEEMNFLKSVYYAELKNKIELDKLRALLINKQ